jgi:flavin reductase (DIM6/NTAB) family NADH-FMN oxidoreductase RutF
MQRIIEPSILYVGTPVVLLSTVGADGQVNLSPISSLWFLGWTAVIGLDASSQTPSNLAHNGECVLNLPSAELVAQVDRLALTTGSERVPLHKRALGYRSERDKFECAGLTPQRSELVAPPRVAECPLQLEARVEHMRPIARRDLHMAVPVMLVELRVLRVHAHESVLMNDDVNRIDPEKWRPLIMSFRRFFTLGAELHDSRLARAPESRYAPIGTQLKNFLRGAWS